MVSSDESNVLVLTPNVFLNVLVLVVWTTLSAEGTKDISDIA